MSDKAGDKKKIKSQRRPLFRGSTSLGRYINNLIVYPAFRQLCKTTFKNKTSCYQ